jgi:hypothetical protein
MTSTTIYNICCPHCQGEIQVAANEVNCTIFRHGVLKSNGMQIGSHASEAECMQLVKTQAIWGCGLPFTFDTKQVNKCGWV